MPNNWHFCNLIIQNLTGFLKIIQFQKWIPVLLQATTYFIKHECYELLCENRRTTHELAYFIINDEFIKIHNIS